MRFLIHIEVISHSPGGLGKAILYLAVGWPRPHRSREPWKEEMARCDRIRREGVGSPHWWSAHLASWRSRSWPWRPPRRV